ncbi:MAG: hypothetical protein NT069_28590 [Planctomycetota bacterium]|nr:hypothetical protein [Planctomycetota bacterium]
MSPRSKVRTDRPHRSEPPPEKPRNRNWSWLLRPWVVGVLGLSGIGVLFGPSVFARWPGLEQRPEYQVPWRSVHITQPPAWISGRLVHDVLHGRDFPESLPLLDPELTRQMEEAFASNPWVERVVSVQKSFPARIDIEMTYRRPVAMVAIDSGEFPIDAHGVLLPLPQKVREDADKYPRIEGARSSPGLVGKPWGDPIVVHAADVAAALEPHWTKLKLTAIICPRTTPRVDSLDDGAFELRAVDGSRILWGHPPGSDHPGAVPTEQKIGRLLDYVEKLGPFGPEHGPHLIDLRPLGEISRKRLPAESPAGR